MSISWQGYVQNLGKKTDKNMAYNKNNQTGKNQKCILFHDLVNS